MDLVPRLLFASRLLGLPTGQENFWVDPPLPGVARNAILKKKDPNAIGLRLVKGQNAAPNIVGRRPGKGQNAAHMAGRRPGKLPRQDAKQPSRDGLDVKKPSYLAFFNLRQICPNKK